MASPAAPKRRRDHADALWMFFDAACPFAVKVATGKIWALSGDGWSDHPNRDPQDYVVLPEQPWLDACCVEKGIGRQFVTMPLDDGYTVVEQLSSAAYPMKAERYEVLSGERSDFFETSLFLCSPAEPGMGIAPGGRMEQDIHDDPYGLDAWDQSHASRCVVSIVNTAQRLAKTGERPPTGPLPNANCPGSTTMAATARRSQGPRN